MTLYAIDYIVATNEDWLDAFVLRGADDEALDLTGSSFLSHIRAAETDLEPSLVASTANGRIAVTTPSNGTINWNISADVLTEKLAPSVYVYDLIWTDINGSEIRLAGGAITVVRGITR